jgi:hypothetical protein
MTMLDMNSEVCQLRAEEERILTSFTQRLIEIPLKRWGAGAHASRCGCALKSDSLKISAGFSNAPALDRDLEPA